MSEQRSWKANWAVEREERLAHLAELPGKEHHERLEALNRVSRLFSTNGTELSDHIGTFVGTDRHVNELPDEFEHEAVRLFHNYVASVATLRDVQRSTHRKVWPERLPDEQRRDRNDSRTIWEVSTYEPKVTELFGVDDQVPVRPPELHGALLGTDDVDRDDLEPSPAWSDGVDQHG
ncbi:hypothetical protein IU479_06625 [Nocardia abscessus]|uniref:hypothetical protein n=1 Tax=Nocardia abscessus TaxID=120957 RepID=UPI0018932075|nr:hypothetical protein [Nocardia abscessus]MBF6217781.1 hypothetical protein [Nocardia abscessus]